MLEPGFTLTHKDVRAPKPSKKSSGRAVRSLKRRFLRKSDESQHRCHTENPKRTRSIKALLFTCQLVCAP